MARPFDRPTPRFAGPVLLGLARTRTLAAVSHPESPASLVRFVAGVFVAAVATTATFSAQSPARSWWLEEPIRFFQTNLPETASTLDAKRYIDQIADFPANTILFNLGGIVAQYPTEVPFHYVSPHMPPRRDLFREVLDEAHARNIRVIGRFDLSKTQKPVYDAHPEWFFKRANGEPAIYNGTYLTCINGGYYHEHGLKILTEALTRYEVDGLFFNMFGNPGEDYSNNPIGRCQCDVCKEKFLARYGRPLPTTGPDPDYQPFMAESTRAAAAKIRELIQRVRPGAAFLTYLDQHTDVIMHESSTVGPRSLPPWAYSGSDNVNRARTAEPSKTVFNMCMSFVDYPWRFVSVPPAEMQLWLYQNLAHGAAPAFSLVGTPDQEDRISLLAAQPVFQWHAQHEDLYIGQQNAARVLLLSNGSEASYRGFFRLLAEQHIPFAATRNLKWLDDPSRRYDLVIAPHGAAPELERYVRAGGRLLVAGPLPPPENLPIARVVNPTARAQAVWRVHDHTLLPSLKDTNLLLHDGGYVELAPLDGPSPLTLIPPAMYGPPEKVWVDKKESTIPGLVFAAHGEGRVAYIPWDVGANYYKYASVAHAGFISDVIDHLLPRGRQLKSNAHPLVEITVMRQPSRQRTLIHFVNLSGHSETAYHPPVEMRDITVELDEPFARARAVHLDQPLDLRTQPSRATFTLPRLGAYEVVVLE